MEEKNYDEIVLKDILMVVWGRKALFSVVAIAIILIGAFATIILPEKTYQSNMIVEVSGTSSGLNIGSSNDQSIQNILNEMIKPLDMNFDTYVEYLLEDEVLEKTISDLKLEDKYDIGSLRSRLNIIPDIENEAISINFRSNDPKEPEKVLNTLTDNYMEYVTEEVKINSEEILTAIEEQTIIEKQKYESTFDTYESFINENKSVEEYEIERQAMYKQIVDFKTDLKNLQIKKEGAKAAIKENNSSGNASGGGMVQTNDGKNIYLGSTKQGLGINLSEIIAMEEATEKTIKSLEEEINKINIDYQRAQIEAISINQKLQISKESYESFAKTYETIQTVSLFDKGKLGISISSKPKEAGMIQTNAKRKMVLLVGIGLAFGIIATFTKAYIDSRKTK